MKHQIKNAIIVTNKVLVPIYLYSTLDNLFNKSKIAIKAMLQDRTKTSSKYYKYIPCALSKGLINKYQKNKKCKAVKNIVLSMCGDGGRIVKLEGEFIRINCFFKKEKIKIFPTKPITGFIRQVEFFKRKQKWYISYCYYTKTDTIVCNGFVGVDRNQRGNVATIADPSTGKVARLGPDIKLWKDNLKLRKAKLQRKGKFGLLKKLKRKQSNRTKEINHKVSKQIVDYAKKHCRAIVLEKLNIKGSKIEHSTQKASWSYFQLEQYITYKASLQGVPVIYIRPEYTSQECSKCGSINKTNTKHYKCSNCGHEDHRDANAAFNIAIRAKKAYGLTGTERFSPAGCIDAPLTSKGRVC
jgi:putative transposase